MNNIIISNKKPIVIGRQGENNVTTIRFSIDALFPHIQNATYGLLHQRHGDAAPYPVATMAIGGYVNWVVNSADVGNVGNGTAQLTAYKDGAVAKSIIFTTITLTSMGTTDAPDPVQLYIDRIVRAGQEAVNAAADAEESAEAAAGSATTAQHAESNATYQAGQAEGFANQAHQSASTAAQAVIDANAAKSAAQTAESNALYYSNQASGFADQAYQSATTADARANQAAARANDAGNSANLASRSANQAAASATAAAQSASDAAASASEAEQAVEDALAAAKESGEFDGPRGYSVYGGSNIIIANWTDGTHTENYCVDKVDAPDAGIGDFILGKRNGEISLMKVAREDANHLFGDGVMDLIGQMGQDGYSPTVSVTTITGGHRITITDAEGDHSYDAMDGASAYEQAVAGGYTGTEQNFNTDLANFKTYAAQTASDATAAEDSATAAGNAQTAAETAQVAAEDAQEAAEEAQAAAAQSATNAATSASTASTKAGEAAQSATAAGNAQTAAETAQGAAEDAQEAAETAQEAAEAAAASVSESAAQITQNTEDVADLKSAFDELLEPTRNLFDKDAITEKSYIKPDGTFEADNISYVSDFIPVVAGETYHRYPDGNTDYRHRIATYDARKNNVSVYTAKDTLTIETGVAYVVIGGLLTEADSTLFAKGDDFVLYEPYKSVVDYDGRYLIAENTEKLSELGTSVAEIETDGWVTPDRTSFLAHTKNYYDPSKVVNGHYMSVSGLDREDSRYSYIPVSVPAGKTVFTSGAINGGARALSGSARMNCVKNTSGVVVASDDTWATAYQYTNTTGSTVTIYFTLFTNYTGHTVTDVMIQLVDSADDVALTEYTLFGYTLSDIILGVADTASLNAIKDVIPVPQSFFEDEINSTAHTIMGLTEKPCLTFNIITDTHLRPANADSVRRTLDSVANITALNRISYADAVVHLGDTVSQAMYTQDGATDAEIYDTMRDYVKRINDITGRAYILNGNHDGKQANIYQQFGWYSVCGRLNEGYATKDGGTNYFYVDYPHIKTRCIFLATPDNIEDAATALYAYTPRLLAWLVNEALDTPDNYGVIFFAHIAPYYTWYIGAMTNRTNFYGICNAYHNHTSYEGAVQSADFSGKTGTKIVAYICGHAHGDAVLAAGQTVNGVDENGNAVTTTNGLPCPCINIGCGLFSTVAMSNYGAVAPARADKTVTQDLWDTMVYRPDLNKIYMVRFGAGSDREIDVN